MTARLDSATCLAVAERIGEEIAAAAIWDGDHCDWVGAMPEEDRDGRLTVAIRPLEADLYGGTAGVGLFLAELSRVTGDQRLRRTAIGALRHAVSRADEIHPSVELGLYAGRPGVALALALAARALDEPALDGGARTIADGLPGLGNSLESDLMSGSAGAIVGLLALRWLLDDERLLESAIHHGEDLLGKAQRSGDAMSWPSPGLRGAPALTGFPHGAAGVAVALLELFAATGTERFRAGAEAAFAYERDLYDPVAGNWPDLRRNAHSSL
jgi:lantibiotic biosynthesis protein